MLVLLTREVSCLQVLSKMRHPKNGMVHSQCIWGDLLIVPKRGHPAFPAHLLLFHSSQHKGTQCLLLNTQFPCLELLVKKNN